MSQQKRKVLILMESMDKGGAEKVLLTLLSNINPLEYDINLLLYFGGGFYQPQLPIYVKIETLYTRGSLISRLSLFLKRRLSIDWIYNYALRRYKNIDFHVIISFMEGFPLLLHSFLTDNSKNNISWIHTDLLADHWTSSIIPFQFERDTYNKMNKLLFVSKNAQDNFIDLFSLNLADSDVFLNPIPRDQIRFDGSKISNTLFIENSFKIVSVGRLSTQKSFDLLISTIDLLVRRGNRVSLKIIGEGNLRDKLSEQIVSLGLSDCISLEGFFSNPYPIVASADLFVSSSFVEGYPLAMCEALCLGIPFVATRTAGSEAILDSGKYGLIVDHRVDSLADAIESIILTPERYNYYKMMAVKRGDSFSIEQTLKRFESIIEGKD